VKEQIVKQTQKYVEYNNKRKRKIKFWGKRLDLVTFEKGKVSLLKTIKTQPTRRWFIPSPLEN